MKHTTQAKAQSFAPASPAAMSAALAFIEADSDFDARYDAVQRELSGFLREKVGTPARGFLASDQLNMSVFGVVFDGNPGAGFISVPAAVADRLREHGLRGNAYFPDVGTPTGKEVMNKLNAVSRVAEQRPLLNAVPGVSAVAIEGTRVVLSRAVSTPDGVVILAGPSALAPTAEVTPIAVKRASADAEALASVARSAPKMRM
jgi:hypothetical protein